MEKLKITLRFLGFFISCFFFSLQLSGQGTTPPTSLTILDDQEDGGGGGYQTVGNTGIETIEISIRVANLAPATQAVLEVPYSIPSPQYPQMGLHYDIAGDQGIIAVNDFYFTNQIINDQAIFRAIVTVPYNLQQECNNVDGNNNLFYVDGTFTVVEYISGAPYPVEPYSDPGEIFSCEAFYNTCGYCAQICPIPDQILQTTRTENWFCNLTFPGTERDGDTTQGRKKNTSGKNTTDVSISVQDFQNKPEGITILDDQKLKVAPNPFKNTTQLQYTFEQAEKYQIRILDNAGRLAQQSSGYAPKGTFTEEINLETLPQGIYFGQIIIEQESINFRLVKSGH